MHHHGNIQYDEVDTTGVLLPTEFHFPKFFEKDDKLLITIKNVDSILKNDRNSRFIQGDEKSRLQRIRQ